MRQRTAFDWRRFLYQSRCPGTVGLIIANIVTFLTMFFAQRDLWRSFIFSSPTVATQPWSLLMYPLVSYHTGVWGSPTLAVVLASYMLWLFGGSLERAWGTPSYLRFFAAATVITSGSVWLGSLLLHTPGALLGPWLPLSALVVAWCLMNPEAVVLFSFVLPLRARYLLWLDVVLTYFGYGLVYGPWLAIFALAGCGFAYLSRRGLPLWPSRRVQPPPLAPSGWRPLEWDGPVRRPPRKSWNPLTLFERWQRKRRFKRLWEDSGMDEMFRDADPDKPR